MDRDFWWADINSGGVSKYKNYLTEYKEDFATGAYQIVAVPKKHEFW